MSIEILHKRFRKYSKTKFSERYEENKNIHFSKSFIRGIFKDILLLKLRLEARHGIHKSDSGINIDSS